jgi:hypothetical protein
LSSHFPKIITPFTNISSQKMPGIIDFTITLYKLTWRFM